MKRRMTISLDEDLERRIRLKQASSVMNTNHSVSFSEMLNKILRDALKKDEDVKVVDESDTKAKGKQEKLLMRMKHSENYSKLMDHVTNGKRREENLEIENKLNTIFNRQA